MRKIKKAKKTISLKGWLKRLKVAFWALLGILLIGFCVWIFESGIASKKWQLIQNEYHQIMGTAGFKVEDVFIEGRLRTPQNDIYTALDIPSNRIMTSVDISKMQASLMNLPWVKKASVARHLPNILYVKIEEKRPIALWQNNQKHMPLDEDGNSVDSMCEDCPYLPVVVGGKAPKHAPEFINALEIDEEIYTRTLSAVFVDGRRWNLFIDDIDNGIIVLMPDGDLKSAFERLARLQKNHKVLDKKIKKLDLRFEDKVIIEPVGKDAITILDKKGGKN